MPTGGQELVTRQQSERARGPPQLHCGSCSREAGPVPTSQLLTRAHGEPAQLTGLLPKPSRRQEGQAEEAMLLGLQPDGHIASPARPE